MGVIYLKKDTNSDIILNHLFKFTSMETTFHTNMLALNDKKPELMNLKDIISAFIIFREEVVTRRITYALNKTREKAQALVALGIILPNVENVAQLIKKSPDSKSA